MRCRLAHLLAEEDETYGEEVIQQFETIVSTLQMIYFNIVNDLSQQLKH